MSISGRYARDGSESAELEGGFALRAEGVEAMRRAASAISRGVESGAPNAYYEDPPRKRCRLDWCRCVGRATAVRDRRSGCSRRLRKQANQEAGALDDGVLIRYN
jgi:hypothetical protein